MPSDIAVRAADADDVPAIQSVARNAWHATYEGILDESTVDEMLERGYAADVIERMVDLDEVGLFVAEDDGEVVGYASCGMTDTVGFGDLDVYAHPDYWGTGVGDDLLDAGLDHLADIGVAQVQDEVLVDNEVGNAFYEKHFERVGRRAVDLAGETRQVNVYERRVR